MHTVSLPLSRPTSCSPLARSLSRTLSLTLSHPQVVSLGSSFKLAADYLHPLELERVKNQEVARGTFYIPRAMPGGERPDHETGMTDLAKTDERCMSAIANLGELYGGELFEDSEPGSGSEDE